jgi:glycosyltransferase involved in cell wall biosynthesis
MQTYENYEVILVDSNSEDDTLQIAYQYRKRMDGKLNIYSMPKEGQVKAINYGLSLAKGNILTFINSDDTYEQGCFNRVAKEFNSKQGIFWLYGVGKVIDSNGQPARSIVTNFKSLWWQKCDARVLSWFDYIVQPTVFWSRPLDLKFNSEYPFCFDYDAWLRLWRLSKPIFVNQHLANWRVHSDAISVKNTNAQIDESLRINLNYAQSWGDIVIQNLVAWGEKVIYEVIK